MASRLYEAARLAQMPVSNDIKFRGAVGQWVHVSKGHRRSDFVLLQRHNARTWSPAVAVRLNASRPHQVVVLQDVLAWAPSWHPLALDDCDQNENCNEEWSGEPRHACRSESIQRTSFMLGNSLAYLCA